MDGVIGTISLCGFSFAPRTWSLCGGQLLAISTNTSLFSLIGTQYGGDGRTNFGLPNLNGRTAVGQGQAPGTNINWQMGYAYGNDQHTLTLNEMPVHSHGAEITTGPTVSLTASTELAESATPSDGAFLAQTKATGGAQDQPEWIYSSSGTSPVTLGGVAVTNNGNVSVNNAGGSVGFNIVQPSLAVNYSICLVGIYPSRN